MSKFSMRSTRRSDRSWKTSTISPPARAALVDSVRYIMHVSWFDLGQVLYALHRGHSVNGGLSILSHLTFSTRDFWTEVAFADRKGLTKHQWRAPSDRKHDS